MWANLVFAIVSIVIAQIPTPPPLPSPTPIPSPTPMGSIEITVPRSDLYVFLATAAAQVNALPADISAPGGVPLMESANSSTLIGYARWMIDPSTVAELLGNKLSGIGHRVYVLSVMVVTLNLVYLAINTATTVIKGVVWIIQQIRRMLPLG